MRANRHNKFTTKDRDNDKAEFNCAVEWRCGWWYGASGGTTPPDLHYFMKSIEMKIRPHEKGVNVN